MDAQLVKYYEKNREADLLRLWLMHKGVAVNLTRRYSFISDFERDDYLQEIFICIWSNYHRWVSARDRGYEFISWLILEGRQTIINYRCRLLHIGTRNPLRRYTERVVLIDDITRFPQDQEVYDEEKIQSLRLALKALSDEEKKAIDLYLDDKVLRKESIAAGKNQDYYSKQLDRAKRKIRNQKSRYFEDMENKWQPMPQMSRGKNENSPYSKKVMQLDGNGDVVKIWPSFSEARRAGFSMSEMSKCAYGRSYSHKGYRWIFVGETNPVILNMPKPRPNRKELLQLDLNGSIIKAYPSLAAATKDGFSGNGIYLTTVGKRSEYKGFKWQYA